MREPIDPFEQMDRMVAQMRRGLWTGSVHQHADEADSRPPTPLPSSDTGSRRSDHALTLEQSAGGFVVFADLPGFETDEIELTFAGGVLSIEGTQDVTDETRSRHRTVHESVRIPGEVLVDEISAHYRNGVLEVTLPADDGDSKHRIDVE